MFGLVITQFFDIHSKKDLVEYVTSYRELPIEEIERIYNIK